MLLQQSIEQNGTEQIFYFRTYTKDIVTIYIYIHLSRLVYATQR